MRDITETIIELGAAIVAITPQLAEQSRGMAEKHTLNFPLLRDPGNSYAAKLGLRFNIPDDLEEVYRTLGINLEESNGEGSWTLPMPARLVIDSGGIVRNADIDPNYTQRPEPEKTIQDVKALI